MRPSRQSQKSGLRFRTPRVEITFAAAAAAAAANTAAAVGVPAYLPVLLPASLSASLPASLSASSPASAELHHVCPTFTNETNKSLHPHIAINVRPSATMALSIVIPHVNPPNRNPIFLPTRQSIPFEPTFPDASHMARWPGPRTHTHKCNWQVSMPAHSSTLRR